MTAKSNATPFDPNDQQHTMFLRAPGRYVVHVESYYRHTTKKGDAAISARIVVLWGPQRGAQVQKIYPFSGRARVFTVELFRAMGAGVVEDTGDDRELSVAIGRRPFIMNCDLGPEFNGTRYIEIRSVEALNKKASDILADLAYEAGVKKSIATEPPEEPSAGIGDIPFMGDDDIPF